MFEIPDNSDLFERYDKEQCVAEERAPKCVWCGQPLGDTYYQINGDDVCEECIDSCRRYA